MNATRICVLAPLAVLRILCAEPALAQQPAAPMTQATVASPTRVFGSATGVVLNFIKADKTADFEEVVAKLKDALQSSPNATRKEQAATQEANTIAENRALPGSAVIASGIPAPIAAKKASS